MKRLYTGCILVIISAAAYGIMPVFTKYAYQENVKVTTLLFLRFAFAALIFFVYAFIKLKKVKVTLKQLAVLFILGGLLYTVQSRCYFYSLKYLPAPLTVLIVFTSPVITAILAYFIDKEKFTVRMVAAISVSISGLAVVVGNAFGKINFYGMILAMGCAVSYSLYVVLSNRVIKKIPAAVISAYSTAFTALCQLIIGLLTSDIDFNIPYKAYAPIAGIVVISTVIAIFAFLKGLDVLGPTRASVISMMEPVFATVFSLLLLNEGLTVPGLIGGAAVLAGAVIVTVTKEHENSDKKLE